MTVKCYWCGAVNEKAAVCCSACKRKLQWSNLLKAMVSPSISRLLDDARLDSAEVLVEERVPAAV